MGLDMYLEKRVFIGAQYEHRQVKGTIDLEAEGVKIPINFKRVSEIVEVVAYWRKANQIHKWFVDNVQDGNDNCADYYVAPEQLEELLALCVDIKANPELADEKLPLCEDGFFFGSYRDGADNGINEYYWQDIDDTIDMLTAVLNEPDAGLASYYYNSSW